ncbi:hypothetical protein [Amycolatopsis pittospori]|uniref:hypothetical protein n=1 Tax=Amycolatopsis pittospori TaxID=2749434 RepID=UPI0015EFDCC0|nr:hypothetical protein [Amycolatopsis pittospori]
MSAPGADDTTRYLCAASYLDPAYGGRAISEFLVEPTRPVPPSPGLDAGKVLAEAIRARARRKNYDGLLILVMLFVVGLGWGSTLLYAWIGLSVLFSIPGWLSSVKPGGERTWNPKGVMLLLFLFPFLLLMVENADDIFDGGPSFLRGLPSEGDTVRLVIAVILALAAGGIVAYERWTLWQLLSTRFRRGANADSSVPGMTGFLTEDFSEQLGRYHGAERLDGVPGAPLVVYRGYNPFVGAGFRRGAWSMAIPLERDPDAGELRPLSTAMLYDGVRAAIERLRTAGPLSPDRRLSGLRVTDMVFTPAAELIDHLASPESRSYLQTLTEPPSTRLTPAEVTHLKEEPREWARYYQRFEVETWDRDLVLSTFLHLAVDETTLYLEWTPFVLPPIRAEYRVVDKMRPDSLRPLAQGLLMWLKLPASLPGRLLNLVSWIRPPKRENGVIDADRYGVAQSLRELASVNLFADYFQLVDIERYEKIIESRLLPAIGKLLGDAGYSTAKFEEQAAVVVNQDITISGNNNAPITQAGLLRRQRRVSQ